MFTSLSVLGSQPIAVPARARCTFGIGCTRHDGSRTLLQASGLGLLDASRKRVLPSSLKLSRC